MGGACMQMRQQCDGRGLYANELLTGRPEWTGRRWQSPGTHRRAPGGSGIRVRQGNRSTRRRFGGTARVQRGPEPAAPPAPEPRLPPPRAARPAAPQAPCRHSPPRQRDSPSDHWSERARYGHHHPQRPLVLPLQRLPPAQVSFLRRGANFRFHRLGPHPDHPGQARPRPPHRSRAALDGSRPVWTPHSGRGALRYPPSIPPPFSRVQESPAGAGAQAGPGSSSEGRCAGGEHFVLVPTTKSGFRSQKWGHGCCPIPDPTRTEPKTGTQQPCPKQASHFTPVPLFSPSRHTHSSAHSRAGPRVLAGVWLPDTCSGLPAPAAAGAAQNVPSGCARLSRTAPACFRFLSPAH
ncbi:uncharacterized protein LOC129120960 [Agelaius phoeniceus]|uniref:uncharacterized protein LOC129120960 n=1 Tax=Agelaius phoeniceus TaxID=39638 RepID=UPI004054E1A8